MIWFLLTENVSPLITRALSAGFSCPPPPAPHLSQEHWVPGAEQSMCSLDRHLVNIRETEQTALAQHLSQPRFCSLTPAPLWGQKSETHPALPGRVFPLMSCLQIEASAPPIQGLDSKPCLLFSPLF